MSLKDIYRKYKSAVMRFMQFISKFSMYYRKIFFETSFKKFERGFFYSDVFLKMKISVME